MYELKNERLRATLDERGGLSLLAGADGERVAFAHDEWRVETDYGLFVSAEGKMPDVAECPSGLRFRYDAGAYRLTVEYRLEPGKGYLRRYLELDNPTPLCVYRVTARHELAEAPARVLDYNTFWNCPTVGFVRYESGGFYTGFEHPYFAVTGDGARVETDFEPSLMLRAGEGYRSEANFFGLYRRSGKLLTQQTPATSMRYNDVAHTRYRNPCGHIPLDLAEVSAFQEYARDYLELRVDHFKLIFYQFFLTLPQQPATDEDEQLYYHYIDNFVKMGGDLVTFNPLVRNAPPVPSRDGHWELAPAGSRAERILNYARGKGLDIGFYMGSAAGNAAYCTSPMTAFALENQPGWKKRDRDGHCASENCIASDDFADWFYQAQRNTIEKYGITLWDWDPGPGNGFFCYSAEHGHIPGKGAYKGFRNAMNVVKRLKEAFPRLYIQGFHGTKEYGLWGFRGFDQHECYWEQDPYCMSAIYPDFSEDRLTAGGMRFQSAWNQLFRFMPPEINHALASRMTQYCMMPQELRELYDELGWKYAFFSSLAVGASMTVTMIPYDVEAISHGEYLAFYRKWIPWARENFAYARYSKPFGGQAACGAMDGFARVMGDRGFLFLFNAGPTYVDAAFELGDEIGLYARGEYKLEWLYPMERVRLYDERAGKARFAYGDTVHMSLPPFGCTLMELSPAGPDEGALLCNLPGTLAVTDRYARVTNSVAPDGQSATGWIVGAPGLRGVSVNGAELPFAARDGAARFTLCYGARALNPAIEAWRRDGQAFPILRHEACGATRLSAAFDAPSAIRERLKRYAPTDPARREQVIAKVGKELGRENYAWARPDRLHLMLPFAHPDHVRNLRAALNGRPLRLLLASASHDRIEARILYFADITDDVRWDAENELTLELDGMDADSFLGARLDYPEGEPTAEVRPASEPTHETSASPIGLPRPLLPLQAGKRRIVVQSAWVAEGLIQENAPYTLCASVNLPPDEVEGVYASAQISIDSHSGPSLRADQRLDYDPETGLWKRALLPGSRRLLIFDGKDIHLWAVGKDGVVSEPLRVAAEWKLQGF